NYVCGVWFGNDDYAPMNRMTGGSLPAMTWHAIMEYAHQGIEIKTIPGVPPLQRKEPLIAANTATKKSEALPERPPTLTRRAADILVRVERLMDDATRALPPTAPAAASGPALRRSSSTRTPGTLAVVDRKPDKATQN